MQTPEHAKAWISYAQMEKRRELVNAKEDPCTPEHNKKDMEKYRTARSILYRGLRHNPASVLILQAWGLLEMQRENYWAAARLLQRCANTDPERCGYLLRWKPVRDVMVAMDGRSKAQHK